MWSFFGAGQKVINSHGIFVHLPCVLLSLCAVMGDDWSNQYLDYAQGFNLTNRMPLWVLPPASLSVQVAAV